MKVLAATRGTKGWGWLSWGVGKAGVKRSLARVVEGGVGHFCLVFRNEHTLRRAIQFLKFVS
jgi:hypothetical protein